MPGIWISETRPGLPVIWRGRVLIPFAHTLGLRLPIPYRGGRAWWFWTRPVSVLVKDSDGSETILPVMNITRRVTWTLYGVCAAFALMALWLNLSNRQKAGPALRAATTQGGKPAKYFAPSRLRKLSHG